VWFEITTLLIPGHNDSDAEIDTECAWLTDNLGADVPLHRLQVCRAGAVIEVVGERLEVHVRRVEVGEKLSPRRVGQVARRHRHRLDPPGPTRVGDVDRVLEEDHRVVGQDTWRAGCVLHRTSGCMSSR
jgi:hypothetical protein